jgi:putative transposase
MSSPAAKPPYAGHRFPAGVISHAVWLYFRFPLSLRMVEEMLAARGVVVSHETVRQWALKFGQEFANRIRRRLPCAGDKWHLDEVAIEIAGVRHWPWRAVDQTGMVLDVLVQSRRDKRAAERLLRKLLKRQCRAPRVMITDKLPSYGAVQGEVMGVGAGSRRTPGRVAQLRLSRYGLGHAVQAQCRPPPSHPEGPLPGPELAGLRGRAEAAR